MKTAPLRSRLGNLLIRLSRARQQAVFYDFHLGLLAKTYPETNWEASFRKMGELGSRDYDWTEPVKAIKAPTLLIFADADFVRLEHIVEFYKALGGGQRDAGLDGSLRPVAQLAIVPGTTHYNIVGDPALPSITKAFLGENRAK